MNSPGKVSRAFYGFEQVIEETAGFAHLRKRRTIAELQILAGFVWKAEGAKGKCPVVKPLTGGQASRYLYRPGETGDIGLITKHRNAGALLHEMAHALGPRDKLDHGPAFRRRCLRLYKTYGDWDGTVE